MGRLMPRQSPLVPAGEGSELALERLELDPNESCPAGETESDTLFFVADGTGKLALGDERHALGHGSAALVLAGENAALTAGTDGLGVVRASAGPGAHRHAPLGNRETVVRLETTGNDLATGARSFQILFGPRNGSARATMFVGFIPPGKAPWHYHLYDEIVWVPMGPGRLHVAERIDELGPGSAFRLHPCEIHIVENASPEKEMVVLGIFTPAGSPSAAYLTVEVAAEYNLAD
jgi:quercetin dioxygenase-like cupin family protein